MIKLFCDRCKDEINLKQGITGDPHIGELRSTSFLSLVDFNSGRVWDDTKNVLCPNCYVMYKKFINGGQLKC
jgi:protein-arginine kinase activator protein McsA